MNFDGGEKRKRGRPIGKDGGKSKRLQIRMSDDTTRNLEWLSDLTGMSKTDVVREAVLAFADSKRSNLIPNRGMTDYEHDRYNGYYEVWDHDDDEEFE